jgi:myo-inositol-1(or 4)-monophosphatase
MSAVSLALTHHGVPVIGVISAPFLGMEYFASTGNGAFLNGSPIRASTTHTLHTAIVSIGDYAVGPDARRKNPHRIALTAALADNVERIRMIGSAALDLAWVADGRTDACVILSNKPWDVAAGVVIAKEAGAAVTDATGQPHGISSAETIAATPGIADELTKLINNNQR